MRGAVGEQSRNSAWWRVRIVASLLLLAALACRTGRPSGAALAPLTASSDEMAMLQLRERLAEPGTIRTLMRVRVTTKERTQSFRAQMAVEDGVRMNLVAYTPVGTTALTLTANGTDVSVKNHLEDSEWEGSAGELARTFGFLGSALTPAEMGQLILGLPPREDLHYEIAPAGLLSASSGDLHVTFEPASFPAQRVVVVRGGDRVEIEHLEVVR